MGEIDAASMSTPGYNEFDTDVHQISPVADPQEKYQKQVCLIILCDFRRLNPNHRTLRIELETRELHNRDLRPHNPRLQSKLKLLWCHKPGQRSLCL